MNMMIIRSAAEMKSDMNTFRVLIADRIGEDGIRILREAGLQVDLRFEIIHEELKRIIPDYDAIIVRSRTRVDSDLIEKGRRLKTIGRAGVGLDNIDVEAATSRGITVYNTPEALSTAVAELTIGLMLSLARQIPMADRTMKEGRWLKKDLTGFELKGKTLGILGFGNIGTEVGRLARGMGMKILVHVHDLIDPSILLELDAREVPHEELLKKSDILTIHIPLSRESHHIIGREELSMMKPGAYIINTSRGGVVDEKALYEAMKGGRLAGAALDVFEEEPQCKSELVTLDRVICTPHIGAQTEEAQKSASSIIARKVINYLQAKG